MMSQRHCDQGNSFRKDNISLGLAYSFRCSVHYHHGGKHGSVQAGMALEEQRVLYLVLKANRRRLTFRQLGGGFCFVLFFKIYLAAVRAMKLGLQAVVSCLTRIPKTKPGSPAEVASTVDHPAISPTV